MLKTCCSEKNLLFPYIPKCHRTQNSMDQLSDFSALCTLIMRYHICITNKRPMGHITHLRNHFKSINTFDYIITLIREENNHYYLYVFSLFCNFLSLEKGKALGLNKLISPSTNDALCQVWLKLAQWFWRRR